jgi:hypothetical protein
MTVARLWDAAQSSAQWQITLQRKYMVDAGSGRKDFQRRKQDVVKDAAALMKPASADLLLQRVVSKRVDGQDRMTMTPRSLGGWG